MEDPPLKHCSINRRCNNRRRGGMVGLSVVLEAHKSGFSKTTQVLNKATLSIGSANPSISPRNPSDPSFSGNIFPTFLDHCFLCKQKLLPANDIYMYKGNKGFCSVECRCRQIFMDEEESVQNKYCSLAAEKPSSSSSSSRSHKPTKNKAGGFAY